MTTISRLCLATATAVGLAWTANAQAGARAPAGGGHHAAPFHAASTGHFRGSRVGHGHYHGGHYGPRVGFYFGVPVFWGPWWGYDPYFYPRERVVYREVISQPVYEETVRELPAGESTGTLQPAPAGGPVGTAYCDSAKAHFPAVRACPEGWRLTPPNG